MVFALLFSVVRGYSQGFIVGAEFASRLNNKEFKGLSMGEPSGSLMTARLTPLLGVEFQEGHKIVFGAEMWQDFGGEDEKFLTEIQPVMFYAFDSEQVAAYAGIFDNKELAGEYSRAIFSEDYMFYDNRIMGLMGRYVSPRFKESFVELVVDWEGTQSAETREKFRVISGGNFTLPCEFYMGYGFTLFHFAGTFNAESIVDQVIINPYVGYKFGEKFKFDARLSALICPQRDRTLGSSWEKPVGGQFDFQVSRWGVEVLNSIYFGDNLQPFYKTRPYGGELYDGNPLYSTTTGIFNRTSVGYNQSFFDDMLNVAGYYIVNHDGKKFSNEQLFLVTVNFEKLFSFKK